LTTSASERASAERSARSETDAAHRGWMGDPGPSKGGLGRRRSVHLDEACPRAPVVHVRNEPVHLIGLRSRWIARGEGDSEAFDVFVEGVGWRPLCQLCGAVGEAHPSRGHQHLALLSARRDATRDVLRRAVAVARERGATWAEIGAALGISKQAAQHRFVSGGRPGAEPKASAAVPRSTG